MGFPDFKALRQAISDVMIIPSNLTNQYGIKEIAMKAITKGGDLNSSCYVINTPDNKAFFVKLCRDSFVEAAVTVPKYLADHNFKNVITSVNNLNNQAWTEVGGCKMLVYPFIKGNDGIEKKLSKTQWTEFGSIMQTFHNTAFSSEIIEKIEQESFSDKWRKKARKILAKIETKTFKEDVANKTVLFLKTHLESIFKLIDSAEAASKAFKTQPFKYVLCHGDIHPGNLLIDKQGKIYIIDWDSVVFAPKERDLMFVGAGITETGMSEEEEASLFYKGYGKTEINHDLISYYRTERIIKDIVEYCEHIFASIPNKNDKDKSLKYLQDNFVPMGTIDRASIKKE